MASQANSRSDSDPLRVAHFRILGRLGEGGMGVVYRAEDETLRRAVALKVLPEASGDEESRQRFLREARSAASISHPNVAVVHHVGEADGHAFIAMELVEGETLRARLQDGALDVATAQEIALQIANGLAAAHDQGILHRDLKPENVVITPAGRVKLLDFGLARPGPERGAADDTDVALAKTTFVTSETGRVMGTPAYMSPEQVLGEPLDLRSDVFSFGIMLYEMLCGVRPFTGNSAPAVLVAIARDPYPPLREKAPAVDEAILAVVARCLAKQPASRFANGGEIAAALSPTTPAVAPTPPISPISPMAFERDETVDEALVSSTRTIAANNYTLRVFDRVFFVRWAGPAPKPQDLQELLSLAVDLRRRLGRPIFYVGVIPSGAEHPTGRSREALAEFGANISPIAEAGHLVIEGEGFRSSVHRSVVTALYAFQRGMAPVHVHKTLEDALGEVAEAMQMRRDVLERALGVLAP